jgi:peptidoglycan L-alanyl-D-glutamate endopeptidase CwlK
LIYETIRTTERQKQLVADKKSQTMKSYHIVGQALDFVPIVNGKEGWNSYNSDPFKTAIKYAKSIGFEWGGDWKGFVDQPHLQFNYKGYGTDKVLDTPKPVETVKPEAKPTVKPVTPKPVEKPVVKPKPLVYPGDILNVGCRGNSVKLVQAKVGVKADGIFGPMTEKAVKNFQKKNGLSTDGKVGPKTWSKLFN